VSSKHPRYRGEVIDAHCHYDASTRARVHHVNRVGGLTAAIHLWDCRWPPARFDESSEWNRLEPALLRCHVPDFSNVGAPGFERALERDLRVAARCGAVGVKVWKNLGLWLRDTSGRRIATNDPRLDALWATAGELGLPIAIHTGDPPAFFAPLTDDNPRIEELRTHPDWWYGGGDFPSLQRLHEELEIVVARYTATRFVAVHFGCFMPWTEVRRMLATYPNYHVDTAAAIADMGRSDVGAVRDLVVDFEDRVIFGTDLLRTEVIEMPNLGPRRWELREYFERHWRFFETGASGLEHPMPDQGAWTVTGLDLPDRVLPRLYSENARAVFRLPGR
jgi:predicted TIM-barrel fold metal-dependent hydrolase